MCKRRDTQTASGSVSAQQTCVNSNRITKTPNQNDGFSFPVFTLPIKTHLFGHFDHSLGNTETEPSRDSRQENPRY